MDQKNIHDRFAELASGSDRPIASQFREVFDSVERAIKSGVSRVQARDELEKMGLKMSQHNFNKLLIRIRQERSEQTVNATPMTPPDENGRTPAKFVASEASRSPGTSDQKILAKSRGVVLPDDWLTAELPPEVIRSLSLDQKAQRRKARDRLFHPSPYDSLDDETKSSL
jgi:hypothetical protein